jgi:FKBP-type peptidyl-prolyl cis-trans isomerase
MKALISVMGLIAVLLVLGCGPKQAPAPEVDEEAAWRDQLFGAPSSSADITWRASGLGIRILNPGAGASPEPTDVVRLHYTGRLKNGEVFDDSRAREKPSDFVLNRMVTGLAAGIPVLRPGGRAEFFVPPQLGYGGLRAGNIPPHSGLIFDVELLAVNPEPAPKS